MFVVCKGDMLLNLELRIQELKLGIQYMSNHFVHFECEVQHSLHILSRLYYKHSKNGVRLYFQSVLGSKRGVSSTLFFFNCLVHLHLNLVSPHSALFATRTGKQVTNQMI